MACLLVLSLSFPHPAKRVQIPQKVIVKYTVAACAVVFLTSFNGLRVIWLQEVKTHLNYLKKGVCRPVGGLPLELTRCPAHQELFRQLLFQCPLGTRHLTSLLLCAAMAQIFAQVAPVFQALGFCFPITAFVMKLVCHGASQTHVGFAGRSSAGTSISYFCISGQRTRSLRSLLLV